MIILLGVTPRISQAQDATLLFWLDDSGKNLICEGAMSERNFDIKCSILRSQFPDVDLYPVFTRTAQNGLQRVGEILPKNIRISHIVVGTHACYRAKNNRTELRELGGFSADGPFGFFGELLELLAQRQNLGQGLHIYLESCSAFSGSVADLKVRADAMAKFTAKLGVNRFSMCGAKRLMLSVDFSSVSSLQKSINAHKKSRLLFGTLGGVWLTGLEAANLFVTNPDLARELVFQISRYLGGTSVAYSALLTALPWLIKPFSGTGGRLYLSDKGQSFIREVDGLSKEAIRLPCAEYL